MILIVGGAGYVGSVLCRELVERGNRVRVVDRGFYGLRGLESVKDRIEIVREDMRKVSDSTLKGVKTIINLGGLSNDPTAEYSPEANFEMNTEATFLLAKRAKEYGIKRYILASSCSIYDRGLANEEEDVILDETSFVAPTAAYGASKLEAEKKILPLSDENFKAVALRKGTVFGFSPRMRYDLVVNTFVKTALKDKKIILNANGQMWRPMVSVNDAVSAYILMANNEETGVFNVSAFNIRISELAIIVQSVLRDMGHTCDIVLNPSQSGVRNYRVSSGKIRSLGWSPSVTIEQAVRQIVGGINAGRMTDFDNPKYYNINWMRVIDEVQEIMMSNKRSYECI